MIGVWAKAWAENKNVTCDFLAQVDSTNTLAKSSSHKGSFLILTDHQTEGRGRGANTWSDVQPGSSLLSSWCFDLNSAIQPIASPLVGLALFESVCDVWPYLEWSLKAPNDLYLHDKKIAGLLLETVSVGPNHRFIVGLGFNALAHPNIENAGSLAEALKNRQSSQSHAELQPNSKSGRPSNLNQNDWTRFLDVFWSRLQKNLSLLTHPKINSENAQKLLVALNQYPKLERKYDEVLSDGSLRVGQKQITWTDL